MPLTKAQGRKTVCTTGWSTKEKLIIGIIQQAESVPRAEAIRRMQRRRKSSFLAVHREWYAARLDDGWLLDFSIPVRNCDGHRLAVPIGGRRRRGFVPFASLNNAEQASDRFLRRIEAGFRSGAGTSPTKTA